MVRQSMAGKPCVQRLPLLIVFCTVMIEKRMRKDEVNLMMEAATQKRTQPVILNKGT